MAKNGNIGLGVFIGFLLMVLIGWIPIIGALIAGAIAGSIAKGAGRGLITGFLSGTIGLIILAIILGMVGGLAGSTLGSASAAVGAGIGIGVSSILFIVEIGDIIVVTIGGLIGGALHPQEIIAELQKEDRSAARNEEDKNEALKALKLRYANGKITKAQYDSMKKDLEE